MIPFLDLKAINLRDEAAFKGALNDVLASGWFTLGKQLISFEEEFAAYCGVNHCIGISDGLDALRLVLQAWEIGEGDEILVPSNTFIATWFAVSQVGARPVPVEPNAYTLNMDPDSIEAAITSKTRAIIPVHLYGQPAEMARIMEIASRYSLHVLEDAAQSHGATFHHRKTGGLGHAAAFSFYPSKNLGALGDGGAITTNDADLAGKLRELRNYGSKQKYVHGKIGSNARLDELQAAFLRIKLRRLDDDNAHRQLVSEIYMEGLADSGLELPYVIEGAKSSWHLFTVHHEARDRLQAGLKEAGIETLIHYPIPPHLQAAYGDFKGSSNCPIAEHSSRTTLSLPIGPTLSAHHASSVVSAVLEQLGR